MEHAIGTRITLEVVEVKNDDCDGCYFGCYGCHGPKDWICDSAYRTDHKNIIYKEICNIGANDVRSNTEKITTIALSRSYIRELAYRNYDILEEYGIDIFLDGYIEGVKAIVEPLGLEIKIVD